MQYQLFLFLSVAALSRAYHAKHPSPTVNDLPVPQGDFFEEHARKNRGYNRVLILGISVFAVALTIVSFCRLT
jgi:hypothetical protein